MNQEELDQILTDHQLWLDTNGTGGMRADLCRANLRGVNLSGANLQEAGLQWANLREANLSGANLRGAHLYGADLQEANLQESNLCGANLHWANLDGVDPPLSIRDCFSFRYTKFSPKALPWLILHPQWPEWKDVTQIVAE